MHTIIISDLHLGSPYCLCDGFPAFIDNLPDDAALVLNGDVTDHRHRHLNPDHVRALDLLRQESTKRDVTWIRGNHDKHYKLKDPVNIRFATSHTIAKRLYVAHGHSFDGFWPYNRIFSALFLFVHRARIKMGARRVHVAVYAKRWTWLYQYLKNHIANNAARFAREHGYDAVTCGHTHFAEDRMIRGVRYINTGSWCEQPISYISVTDNEITLKDILTPDS